MDRSLRALLWFSLTLLPCLASPAHAVDSPAQPAYQYRSLRGASDAEILAFMARTPRAPNARLTSQPAHALSAMPAWIPAVLEQLKLRRRAPVTDIPKGLPTDLINELTAPGIDAPPQAGKPDDLGQWIGQTILIVTDPSRYWADRVEALHQLAPDNQPMRYADPRIDQAMLDTIKAGNQQPGEMDFVCQEACMALALRGGAKYFPTVMEVVRRNGTGEAFIEAPFDSLIYMAITASDDRYRRELGQYIQPQLQATQMDIQRVIVWLWLLDLRHLEPQLQGLAGSNLQAPDGPLAGAWSTVPRRVQGQYSIARKVLALWNEEDPLTRGKLLLAFALSNPILGDSHNRDFRLLAEFTALDRTLSLDQKRELLRFLRAATGRPWASEEFLPAIQAALDMKD